MRALLLLVSCALAGAAAAEAPHPLVRDVVFCGVERFDPDDLADGLETQATSRLPFTANHPLDPDALRRDLDRVRTWYRARGYFHVRVAERPCDPSPGAELRVVIDVTEGEPSKVRAVTVEGLEGVVWGAGVAVTPGAPLEAGAVFRVADYEAAKQRLRTALDRSGYLRADVSGLAEVLEAQDLVDVRIVVTPGSRYCMRDLVVERTEKVSARAVRRTVDLAPGTLLTGALLQGARTRLVRTGVFRAVELQVVEPEGPPGAASDPPRPVDLRARLDDGRPRYLRLAGGYEVSPASHGPRVRATWGHGNFLGDLRTLEFSNEASYRFLPSGLQGFALLSRVSFTQPGVFDARTRLDTFVAYERRFEESFTTNGALTGVGLSRRLGRHVDLSVGYQIEATAFEGPPPADVRAESSFVDPYLLSSVVANLLVAFRDDPLFPTRGWTFNLFVRDAGGPVLRGSFEFLRLEPSVHAYWPLAANRFVLASRAQYGFILPYGPDGGVPLTHRLYVGGPASARAWGFDRLSPRSTVDPNKPVGGRSSFFASVEPRVRVFAELWLVPFLDVANVQTEQLADPFVDPSFGTGLGALYRTPVGPLRVDVGWRLNAQAARYPGESRWAVNFSFGTAF